MNWEMAGGIVTLWTILSAMTFLLYTVNREDKRKASWSELVLIVLCFPGVIVVVLIAALSILLGMAWGFLDKPIRKSKDD